MKNLLIISLLLIFIVVGCNSMEKKYNVMISRFPDKLEYIKFENGQDVSRVFITKGEKQYDRLFSWILQNKDKWKKSYITFAPQNKFRSNDININVIKGLIIVNFRVYENKWMQIVREIEKNSTIVLE